MKHKPAGQRDEAASGSKARASQPLPKWKIIVFRSIFLFVFPILFFILLEYGLALAGVGFPTDFYLSEKRNGETIYRSNPYFIKPYFGTGVSKECMPFSIPAKKPDDTVRIFVLGASAAQGDPDPAYGISRQLEMMHMQQFPGHKIEVYNVAVTAINSHVVLPIMRACVDMDPDVFIIYLGNNEVVGPYGAGSVFSSAYKSRWLISLQTRLRASRFGQWVGTTFKKESGQPQDWQGMEMFLNNPVAQDDPRMETVYKHFRNNLRAMFKIGSRHRIPVIISTVAVNLKDNAPFGSQHRSNLSDQELVIWDRKFAQGVEQQKLKQYDKALVEYHEALQLDAQYADLHFRIGECYLETGQVDLAKQSFQKSRDLDVLRFRADSTINKIIEDNSEAFDHVTFVDGKKALEVHCSDGIPGTDFFYEHVHLNFRGNYLMAKTLCSAVLKSLEANAGLKPGWDGIISESEMQKRLAYTRWDQLKIAQFNLERLKGPPFTSQSDIDKQQAKWQSEVDTLVSTFSDQVVQEVLQQYQYALQHYPNWFLYDHLADFYYNGIGNNQLAEQYYQKALDEYPDYTLSLEQFGKFKVSVGKYQEAEELFRRSIALEPAVAQKKVNLGVVIGSQGRYEEAVKILREVVADHGYLETAYYNLAVYLFNLDADNPDNQKEALRYWQKVLENNPDYLEARYGLARIYQQQGQREQAIRELEKNLEMDPSHKSSLELLVQLQKK